MYKEKFVLSIIHDGRPVKESGTGSNREVAIPFGSEYKIRLKNKNNVACTARVFVDGKKLSGLGDVVVGAGGSIDLERFIDRSLNNGKKLKFVSLDDVNVDDPTDSNNGIIKVEFRLAKNEVIKIKPDYGFGYSCWSDFVGTKNANPIQWYWYECDLDLTYDDRNKRELPRKTGPFNDNSSKIHYCSSFSEPVKSFNSDVENGATVEGSSSNQQFVYSDLEVKNIPVILQLKLVGLRNQGAPVSINYCAKCGKKVNVLDKYCSSCGNRLK